MESLIALSTLCFAVLGLWLNEKNQHDKTHHRLNNENYKWQGEFDKWHTCYLGQREDNLRLINKFPITDKPK